MTRTTFSMVYVLAAGVSALSLGACSSGGAGSSTGPVPAEYLEGSPLDRNAIEVVKRTEFLEVDIHPEASTVSDADRRRIGAFIGAYQSTGQGPLIVSLPVSSANPQLAVAATAEARTIAYERGVKYEEIAGTTHGEGSGLNEPLVMAYQTYEAIAPDCKSFAEINVADVTSNNELPNFGCAVRTNLAAMIADPSDLLGNRPLDAGDPVRRSIILDKFRNGESTGAERSDDESGTVSEAVSE